MSDNPKLFERTYKPGPYGMSAERDDWQTRITLRDLYIHALVSGFSNVIDAPDHAAFARDVFDVADALLAERAKR